MTVRCIQCAHTQYEPDCDCCEIWDHCEDCKQPKWQIHDTDSFFDEKHNPCWCCKCHSQFPCPDPGLGYVVSDGGFETHGVGKTPWELRGVQIPANNKYFAWQVAWPMLAEYNQKLDVCQAAANFYLLDAMRHGLINREHECTERPCRHLEMWDESLQPERHEAEVDFQLLVWLLDGVFCEYVEMACGGELRHHGACGGGKFLSHHRRTAWAEWKWIHECLGDQALLDGAELFDQFPSGAFGGAKWAYALRLLHQRLTNKISPLIWVDRVFTLVHNGGVFLNKLDWPVKNELNWNLHYLQAKVLPAQEADAWSTLLRVADKDTRRLWDRYWRHSNKARVRSAMRPTVNVRSNPRRRVICASCASNPRVGHTMRCLYFVQGTLREDGEVLTRSVMEEEWPDYTWHQWEQPVMPVGPKGEVRILPDLTYKISVEVHTSDAVKIRRFSGSGKDLMEVTMKFQRAIPTVPGLEESPDTEFWFVIQIFDAREAVRLGGFESRHTTNRQAFKEKYLTFGHILPLVMGDIDWSHVQKELV